MDKKRERGSIIVISLGSWEDKRLVKIKKNKLKEKNLFIDNDLTKKKKDIQNSILELTIAERRAGVKVKAG